MKEKDISQEDNNQKAVLVNTHKKINENLVGDIIKLENGYVELRLATTEDMVADSLGLIHGGFIFSTADYAAMLAVNEPNVVLVASDCQFLSPVELHDEVNFIAKLRNKEGRKRNVHVTAFVLNIKVFDGEFKTVITDKHVLKLKLVKNDN